MHRFIAVGALCAGALLLVAAPASAHSQLVSSTPAADETVTTLPPQFSVTMNEDLLDLAGDGTGFGIQVTDAAGRFYGDGCVTIAGPTLTMGASLGGPGSYRLVYQVVSDDGHPVSAEFAFTWTGEATGPGSDTPPVCGQAVTTFPAMPTAGPTPEPTPSPTQSATAEPGGGVPPAVPIALGIIGVLALGGVIALAISRQRRL
jgi:methionine-rich copper-binding protein CopC